MKPKNSFTVDELAHLLNALRPCYEERPLSLIYLLNNLGYDTGNTPDVDGNMTIHWLLLQDLEMIHKVLAVVRGQANSIAFESEAEIATNIIEAKLLKQNVARTGSDVFTRRIYDWLLAPVHECDLKNHIDFSTPEAMRSSWEDYLAIRLGPNMHGPIGDLIGAFHIDWTKIHQGTDEGDVFYDDYLRSTGQDKDQGGED